MLAFCSSVFFESAQLLFGGFIKEKSIIILLRSLNWVNVMIYFSIIALLMIICYLYSEIICKYLYKYRYIIAIGIFILCVIFEINGSSIGLWGNYLSSNGNAGDINNVIVGQSRMIRTDEWATNTAMTFSQYFNKPEAFSYFSETIRGDLTDCFIIYGQPIKSILMIFRPFQIGFLLFNPGRGLAFFWCGRIIALFMVTFELAMIITKKNKKLSVICSFLVVFAPIIQWWFAINGLVEMLFFGQLAIIIIRKYMKDNNYWHRIIYSIILAVCAGGYILTIYPAWMVPLAYVFLALLVWIILENYKKFEFDWKKDVPIIILCIAIVGISMGYIFTKSMDTVNIVSDTVYPGKRMSVGGNGFFAMWTYISNIFFSYTDKNLPLNVCEMSSFFDFFPMGLLLSLFVIIKEKNKDSLLISLIVVNVLLTLYCTLSFPTLLAKITLLSHSTTVRAYIGVGLVNILLLIRSLTLIKTKMNKVIAIVLSIVCSSVITFFAKKYTGAYLTNSMFVICLVILAAIFMVILLSINDKKKNIFSVCSIGLILISGFFVNPVRIGASEVTDNKILNVVKDIVKEDDGLWIVEGMGLPMNNALIMAGARTINSTNVYPDLERWNSIDIDKEYENVYNRYAHITVNITNNKDSRFELISPDAFNVDLSLEDLKKLDVKYIFTRNNLSKFSNDYVNFKEKDVIGDYYIYEVN